MSRCDLYLDNYLGYYYPGQEIVGRFKCSFASPKYTTGIHLKIKGFARVSWSESNSNNDDTSSSTTYIGNQEFFREKRDLLYQGGHKFDVPAGEHMFPFTYTLPPDLPSSYDSVTGKIRYTIKGYVDRSLQFDIKAEMEFKVAEVFDLNRCPNLLIPVNITKQKTLGCFGCRSGQIELSLNVPYTGFVPGQRVPFTVRIENSTSTSIPKVGFSIREDIYYYSNTRKRKHRVPSDKITSSKDTGVWAHGERTYEAHLQIPASFTPINFKACTIIDVIYTLHIELDIPGFHRNFVCAVPIEIGNVALVDSGYREQQFPPVMGQVEPEVAVIGQEDGFAVVGPNVYPSAPPQMGGPPFGADGPSIIPVPVPPLAAEAWHQPGPGDFNVNDAKPEIGTSHGSGAEIGWKNPVNEPAKPPSYDDLFTTKD